MATPGEPAEADAARVARLRLLVPDEDVSDGRWWRVRWDQPAVGSVIPSGFAAYARILHRAGSDGGPVRWRDIADALGTRLHPESQFWRLARYAGPHEPPGGAATTWSDPQEGSLDAGSLTALVALLTGYAGSPECRCAVWDGYGQLPAAWSGLPKLACPHREYHLFRRRLSEVVGLAEDLELVGLAQDAGRSFAVFGPGEPDPARLVAAFAKAGRVQSPNAWWPVDRSWAVATEIDHDSTLVGGTEEVVSAVLDDPWLEALPWPLSARLSYDADPG